MLLQSSIMLLHSSIMPSDGRMVHDFGSVGAYVCVTSCIIIPHGAACVQLTHLLAARETSHTPYHQGPPAPAQLTIPSAVQNTEAGQEGVQATLHTAQKRNHEHMEELHHQVSVAFGSCLPAFRRHCRGWRSSGCSGCKGLHHLLVAKRLLQLCREQAPGYCCFRTHVKCPLILVATKRECGCATALSSILLNERVYEREGSRSQTCTRRVQTCTRCRGTVCKCPGRRWSTVYRFCEPTLAPSTLPPCFLTSCSATSHG